MKNKKNHKNLKTFIFVNTTDYNEVIEIKAINENVATSRALNKLGWARINNTGQD
jgi:uncharacterized membrane protein YjfL (UPF0719 family)